MEEKEDKEHVEKLHREIAVLKRTTDRWKELVCKRDDEISELVEENKLLRKDRVTLDKLEVENRLLRKDSIAFLNKEVLEENKKLWSVVGNAKSIKSKIDSELSKLIYSLPLPHERKVAIIKKEKGESEK